MNNKKVLLIAACLAGFTEALKRHEFNVVDMMATPEGCDRDVFYEMRNEHHHHNLRAPTIAFDRVQQRRKQLALNFSKKHSKGTPKGSRKREKRFTDAR